MGRPKNIANIYNPPKSNVQFSEGQKSKGILDDSPVRSDIHTKAIEANEVTQKSSTASGQVTLKDKGADEARIFLGTQTNDDSYMDIGAFSGKNNIDSKTRALRLFGTTAGTFVEFNKTTGEANFDDNDLTTTGDITQENAKVNGDITLADGSQLLGLGATYGINMTFNDGAVKIGATGAAQTAIFRLLPWQDDIWFQNTEAGGKIYFSAGGGTTNTGGVTFLTSGTVDFSSGDLTTTGDLTAGDGTFNGNGTSTSVKAVQATDGAGGCSFQSDAHTNRVADYRFLHLGTQVWNWRSIHDDVLQLNRYNTSGTYQDTPISIDHGTGEVTFVNEVQLDEIGLLTLGAGSIKINNNVTVTGVMAATSLQGTYETDTMTIQNGGAGTGIIFKDGGTTIGRIRPDSTDILLELESGKDFEIGDGTNYAEFSEDGDLTFVGTAGLPYAEIYAYDTNTTITITSSGIANKVQVTSFAVNGLSNNATPDHTNDHITIVKAGVYKVNVSISAESVGGTSYEIGFGVYKNNGATLFQNCHAHRNLTGGGTDTGSISMTGLIDLAVNDTIEVWTWNETNTNNIIVDDITLNLIQIGG